ncbi:hypothetical protein ACFL26_00595 [Patescibacteria group bacterium]
MQATRMLLSAAVIALALGSASCELLCDDCNWQRHTSPSTEIAWMSTVQDTNTQLCFGYVYWHDRRSSLTSIPCDAIRDSLRWGSEEDTFVQRELRYGEVVQARDRHICFAYLVGDEFVRSNAAYVPCEPVFAAREAGRITVRRHVT